MSKSLKDYIINTDQCNKSQTVHVNNQIFTCKSQQLVAKTSLHQQDNNVGLQLSAPLLLLSRDKHSQDCTEHELHRSTHKQKEKSIDTTANDTVINQTLTKTTCVYDKFSNAGTSQNNEK